MIILGFILALIGHRESTPAFETLDLDEVSEAVTRFRYKELAAATDNFCNELGKGGFGAVYKGLLANGQAVAVKKLDGSAQGEKQFRAEVHNCTLISAESRMFLFGFGGVSGTLVECLTVRFIFFRWQPSATYTISIWCACSATAPSVPSGSWCTSSCPTALSTSTSSPSPTGPRARSHGHTDSPSCATLRGDWRTCTKAAGNELSTAT